MTSHALYDRLGLPMDASGDDVKRAFRRLAVKHHPDKGGDAEEFKQIAHAYEVLSDPKKRGLYDQLGDAAYENGQAGGDAGFHDMDPSHLFQQFFGHGFTPADVNQMRAARRCSDQMHPMKISLDEAYNGASRSIKVTLRRSCADCMVACNVCQGRGQVTDMRRMGFFVQTMTRACMVCAGVGKMVAPQRGCSTCSGQGSRAMEQRAEVIIPPGVQTGHQVRLEGMGEQPVADDDTAGDLVIHIVVQEHAAFVRNGDDLRYSHDLTFVESVLGKCVSVPHFSGNLDVDTSAFGIVQPNASYTVNGKGMPRAGGGFGDLHIAFRVAYPSDPSEVAEIRKLFRPEKQRQVGDETLPGVTLTTTVCH